MTRRLPLLIEALGPAPGEARAHMFAARVVAAILEHGDGGVALAHLPKKFRLLWGREFGEAGLHEYLHHKTIIAAPAAHTWNWFG